jgi:hypothetical protein
MLLRSHQKLPQDYSVANSLPILRISAMISCLRFSDGFFEPDTYAAKSFNQLNLAVNSKFCLSIRPV